MKQNFLERSEQIEKEPVISICAYNALLILSTLVQATYPNVN